MQYVFLHPTEFAGWDGDGFVADFRTWLKYDNLQAFADEQMALIARDLEYRTALFSAEPEQIKDGPDAGQWRIRCKATLFTLERRD